MIARLILVVALIVPTASFALTHTGKTIETVHSPDGRDCTFFRLTGVSEADPVTPGVSWFAVSQSHIGYKEMVAILLATRLGGTPINVTTTGSTACGHASVAAISF